MDIVFPFVFLVFESRADHLKILNPHKKPGNR